MAWSNHLDYDIMPRLVELHYTVYDILCHYGNFLDGILIMNKRTTIDMGDG
jgi:hypothetical protein